ncbi:hypothetical protein LUZ60_015766 [Juncus effusus]|nr:hypothetical protein LUZ60_015766 [Juncus effusus]
MCRIEREGQGRFTGPAQPSLLYCNSEAQHDCTNKLPDPFKPKIPRGKKKRKLNNEREESEKFIRNAKAKEERKSLPLSKFRFFHRPDLRIYCISSEKEMASWRFEYYFLFALALILHMGPALGIRFVIDREECFSHNVEYEGDTVHSSFVVIKADTPWHYSDDGVDLVVKDPSGAQIHDSRDKTSDKFEFVVQRRGLHRFCFTNKSPYHETIDFDVHVGHFSYFDQHAKDEHFQPLFEQIAKLDEALYNIQFEQHWLEAQTDRQAILNEGMSKRAIQKAVLESFALVAASFVQIYLLRRLFERKLGTSRV